MALKPAQAAHSHAATQTITASINANICVGRKITALIITLASKIAVITRCLSMFYLFACASESSFSTSVPLQSFFQTYCVKIWP